MYTDYLLGAVNTADWAPTDIGGCVLWLRSDLGVTKDGVDRVSEWADQSGNANHATQGVDAKKPVYHANQINGHATIRFDGADDFMTCVQMLSQSVFAVVNHTDGASFSNYRRLVDASDTLGWSIFGENNSSLYNSHGVFPRGIAQANFYVNGVNTGEAAPLVNYKYLSGIATNQANKIITIGDYDSGSGQPLLGNIAEIILYDSALSADNRLLVEDYLATRYGL